MAESEGGVQGMEGAQELAAFLEAAKAAEVLQQVAVMSLTVECEGCCTTFTESVQILRGAGGALGVLRTCAADEGVRTKAYFLVKGTRSAGKGLSDLPGSLLNFPNTPWRTAEGDSGDWCVNQAVLCPVCSYAREVEDDVRYREREQATAQLRAEADAALQRLKEAEEPLRLKAEAPWALQRRQALMAAIKRAEERKAAEPTQGANVPEFPEEPAGE